MPALFNFLILSFENMYMLFISLRLTSEYTLLKKSAITYPQAGLEDETAGFGEELGAVHVFS